MTAAKEIVVKQQQMEDNNDVIGKVEQLQVQVKVVQVQVASLEQLVRQLVNEIDI